MDHEALFCDLASCFLARNPFSSLLQALTSTQKIVLARAIWAYEEIILEAVEVRNTTSLTKCFFSEIIFGSYTKVSKERRSRASMMREMQNNNDKRCPLRFVSGLTTEMKETATKRFKKAFFFD